LHALTVATKPDELNAQIISLTKTYLACGIDPKKSVIYQQSSLHEHAELCWLLNTITKVPELERMTQFKDKSAKQTTGITAALFTYPSLMAADILLYDADYVPVGEDQKQHLELTRNIANRFNNRYGDFFKVPEPLIPKVGARIMDLQNPLKKMSKSDSSDKGYISLLDEETVILKKIKSAVTDSLGVVGFDPANQPGVANLLTIYSALTNQPIETIVSKYQGQGYKEFKEDLAEIVANEIVPLQKRFYQILESGELDMILDSGRERASQVAFRKIMKCKQKVGLGRKK
jgi:tryptophanyl-tRNA synthetase